MRKIKERISKTTAVFASITLLALVPLYAYAQEQTASEDAVQETAYDTVEPATAYGTEEPVNTYDPATPEEDVQETGSNSAESPEPADAGLQDDLEGDELQDDEITLESITITPFYKDVSKGIIRDNVILVPEDYQISYTVEPAELQDKVEVYITSSNKYSINIDHKRNTIYCVGSGAADLVATATYKQEGKSDQIVTSDALRVDAVYPTDCLFDFFGICYAADENSLYGGWLSEKNGRFYPEKKEGKYNVYYFGWTNDHEYYPRAVTGGQKIDDTWYRFASDGKLIKEWIKLESVSLLPVTEDSGEGVVAPNTLARGSRVMIKAKLYPERTNDARDPEWKVTYKNKPLDESVMTVTTCRPKDAKDDEFYAYVDVKEFPEDPDESINIKLTLGESDNRITTDDDNDLDLYITYPTGFQTYGDKTYFGETYADGERTKVRFVKGWWPEDPDTDPDKNKYYYFTKDGENAGVMVTGMMEGEHAFYDLGEDGVLKAVYKKDGFVPLPEGTVYYDADENRVADAVVEDEKGNLVYIDTDGFLVTSDKGFFKCGSDWYYAGKGGKLQKGALSLKRDKKTYKYYFGEDAKMCTGVTAVGTKKYYYMEYSEEHATSRDPLNNYVYGSLQYGVKGEIDSENPETQYYVNSSGVIQTGWRFKNVSGKYVPMYYSAEDANFGQLQEVTPLDGRDTGWYELGGDLYYIAGGKTLKKGNTKLKLTAEGGEKKDYTFILDPVTGKYYGTTGTVYSGGKYYYAVMMEEPFKSILGYPHVVLMTPSDVPEPVWHGNWAVFDDGNVFYYKNRKTLVKGVAKLTGTYEEPDDPTENRFLFDSKTGLLKKSKSGMGYSIFNEGSNTYEADNYGRLTVGWGWLYDKAGVPTVRTMTENENVQADSFYDANARRVKKKLLTIDSGNSSGTYYFDANGKMATGITTVSGKKYMLGKNTIDISGHPEISRDRGKLHKNYFGPLDGEDKNYLSDKNGYALTGWVKYTAPGDEMRWHYFDPVTFDEHLGTWSGNWYIIKIFANGRDERSKFYFSNSGPVKGFKTIEKRKYYFDKTGKLATGLWTISGKKYYFNETVSDVPPHVEGELVSGTVQSVGNSSYFLTSSGSAKTGWFTDNGAKYYADPKTGKLATGFKKINGKIYFFADDGADLGKMQTGFFKLSYRQQIYYDKKDGASNIYYADDKGVVAQSGWKNVKIEPKVKDSQEWSYYLDPGRPSIDMGDFVLTGEVTVGDVLINDDGSVRFLDDGYGENDGFDADQEGVTQADIAKYYRFNTFTGARRKEVLYFYGNYYGMSTIDGNQINTVASMMRYINTDRRNQSESSDFVIANAGADFPRCASSKIDDEKDSYVLQTTASDNDLNDDGHIDVLDTEIKSKHIYDIFINRFGPKNLVLAGSSSGAGICLGLYDYAISQNDPLKLPAQLLLISPWVDVSMSNTDCMKLKSSQTGSTDVDTLKYWGARYTRDRYYEEGNVRPYKDIAGKGVTYPFASPLRSANKQRMKNVVMYTGSYDPCSFDCVAFASNAANAGNKSIIVNKYSKERHGFMFFSGTSNAKKAILDMCKRIMTQ